MSRPGDRQGLSRARGDGALASARSSPLTPYERPKHSQIELRREGQSLEIIVPPRRLLRERLKPAFILFFAIAIGAPIISFMAGPQGELYVVGAAVAIGLFTMFWVWLGKGARVGVNLLLDRTRGYRVEGRKRRGAGPSSGSLASILGTEIRVVPQFRHGDVRVLSLRTRGGLLDVVEVASVHEERWLRSEIESFLNQA